MQSDGKTSMNVFVAKGGTVSGQALTVVDNGLDSLPVTAYISPSSVDGVHAPALHWPDDATLFEPGTSKNALSLRIDDPSTLSRISSTVRLTS